MHNDIYWIWLQKSLGFGARINDLVRFYGSAKEIYGAGEASWRESGFFGKSLFDINPSGIESMKSTKLSSCEKIIRDCEENEIQIVTPENEIYPQNLKHIADYPAVLYVKGDLSCLKNKLPIAVIGTRKPSSYGISAAEKIARGLAKQKAVIISGGALGIDSIAHKSALEESGKTVLVMGCGYGAGYLMQNEALRQSVSQNGAVISEYPPFFKASLSSFPKRNRIISGISKGVVIIEAGENSGTLNTASHAAKQGRDIFAVPGDISSVAYAGSNKLIRLGATAVFSADDVMGYYSYSLGAIKEMEKDSRKEPFSGIDEFAYGNNEKRKKPAAKKSVSEEKTEKADENKENETNKSEKILKFNPESVSKSAKLVYNHMSDEEMQLDDITRKCGLPVRKVIAALTELEMANAIILCGAGRYRKKDG
ncbi:MAG: DNA-processing protein DprA [Acutalibacteraceae bacterium]